MDGIFFPSLPVGAVSHDLLRRRGDYSLPSSPFFFVNLHLERQCVFVKLIVIHLFTSLVNKWDHYGVCGGGGVALKKRKKERKKLASRCVHKKFCLCRKTLVFWRRFLLFGFFWGCCVAINQRKRTTRCKYQDNGQRGFCINQTAAGRVEEKAAAGRNKPRNYHDLFSFPHITSD